MIAAQVAAGLAYINGPRHRIIHYDLKPANILFNSFGEVKITVRRPATLTPSVQTACLSSHNVGRLCSADIQLSIDFPAAENVRRVITFASIVVRYTKSRTDPLFVCGLHCSVLFTVLRVWCLVVIIRPVGG